ncbi:MAG: bifunctional 4-hydroxy-2-oxoglutarate aldolase/2-dehydro-3-deoxy-phosphogluconate aldolase [Anaerolineae bacterium]|nr:bifunctional 4-hydroxy-2-oxoglutarate aldolase/2-dehydro-3-deoxy-phosphogluconate aldolase [Anaerolineae bacterium]
MFKHDVVARILRTGVIAIVRLDSAESLQKVADAILEGGIDIIEFTMTTPGALDILDKATAKFGDRVILGAGTVLDAESARAAVLAGARFVVSPNLNARTVELCHRYGVVAVPGVLTPTEIVAAMEAGADLIKVFPASLGGPEYIKAVRAPLPQAPLVPTGGVEVSNAVDYIRAGAVAVAIGGSLVNKKWVAAGDFAKMTETARRLVETVQAARAGAEA